MFFLETIGTVIPIAKFFASFIVCTEQMKLH